MPKNATKRVAPKNATPKKVTVRTVDPQTAQQWLAYNTHNRGTRPTVLSEYVTSMESGDWEEDTDPIRFAGYLDSAKHPPVLLNGQHRLQAIVATGTSHELIVVEGLSLRAQVQMDTGSRRRLADQLRLQGHGNALELAALLRMVYLYDKNLLRGRRGSPAFNALLAYLDAHPHIGEALAPARRLYTSIGGSVTVYGTAYHVISDMDDPDGGHAQLQADLESWWDRLVSGADCRAGDPVLLFRNAVINMTAGTRRRVPPAQLLALQFKAWNAFRDGVRLTGLTYRIGGSSPEEYPTPH